MNEPSRPVLLSIAAALLSATAPSQRLASWQNQDQRDGILRFIDACADRKHRAFAPEKERIAVIDFDGALACDEPLPWHLQFAAERVRRQSAKHSRWREQPVMRAVVDRDEVAMRTFDAGQALEAAAAATAGMTDTEHAAAVQAWLEKARHARFDRLLRDTTYQPMRELIDALRGRQFKVFLLTSGDAAFVQQFSQALFGIPPQRVIGSRIAREGNARGDRFEFAAHGPALVEHLAKALGSHPLLAIGNADADLPLLTHAGGAPRPRLVMLLRHDDAEREYRYTAQSFNARHELAVAAAHANLWLMISIKDDWKTVFAAR